MSLTDRSARRGTGTVRSAAADIDARWSPIRGDRAGEQQRHGARQEPVLDRVDPRVEARLVVVGQDRHRLLGDDRAAVERGVDEVDGGAGHPRAVGERIADGVGARERGQQRGMGVDDPPAERGERPRVR